MRILITGITGFAGGHLTEALLEHPETELAGVSREGEWPARLAYLTPRVQLFRADLCDEAGLTDLLRRTAPDQIYHLAGHADVGRSFKEPEQAWRDNLTATRSLYDAINSWGGKPRILYVGSGLVYGAPRRAGQVFDEDSPLYPLHPYASSKAAADLLSYQYTQFPGLEIIRARPFNHIGPRQSPQFAVAHFAHQLATIESGQQTPVLFTGNLDTCRDITDVRDVARAYIVLMERGTPGEAYNIASENLLPMQDVLQKLLGLTRVQVEVRRKVELARASEPFLMRVSTAKIRAQTGWRPEITLAQSLTDTLNYWRGTRAAA